MTRVNLDNVTFVLSRPVYGGNVGSVARAMSNMGLRRLRLAGPPAEWNGEEALRMACDGRPLLEAAGVYNHLRDAVADQQLVIGTTRRVGLVREHVLTPRAVAEKLAALSQSSPVAFVFGNEGSGLSNDEIALCQWLVTIPTHPDQKSINLAQAVMIIAYELYLTESDQPPEPVLDLAPADAVEGMYEALRAALLSIGFLDPINPERMMFALRRILGRARLEKRDLKILRGIARQIDWYATKGRMKDEE